jgi:hypothetical protein
MGDFSITRPESVTPTNDAGKKDSQHGNSHQQRRPRPAPEATPENAETPHEDEGTHQIDELA